MAFATALVPAMSKATAKGDIKTVEKRIKFSILVSILIGLPCMVGMILYAKQILLLLFPNAASGEFIYQISCLGIIFILIVNFIGIYFNFHIGINWITILIVRNFRSTRRNIYYIGKKFYIKNRGEWFSPSPLARV